MYVCMNLLWLMMDVHMNPMISMGMHVRTAHDLWISAFVSDSECIIGCGESAVTGAITLINVRFIRRLSAPNYDILVAMAPRGTNLQSAADAVRAMCRYALCDSSLSLSVCLFVYFCLCVSVCVSLAVYSWLYASTGMFIFVICLYASVCRSLTDRHRQTDRYRQIQTDRQTDRHLLDHINKRRKCYVMNNCGK